MENSSDRKVILSPLQRILGEDFNPILLGIVFRKSIIWVIIFVLITTTISLTYLRYSKAIYESSAILIMLPQNTAATALDMPASPFQQNSVTELLNDVEVVKSQSVSLAALRTLPLAISYYNTGEVI